MIATAVFRLKRRATLLAILVSWHLVTAAPAQECGWVQMSGTGPNPRWQSAMSFDSDRGVSVLFSGSENYYSHSGDTWEWNGDAWTLKSSRRADRHVGHAMVYYAHRRKTLRFGGWTDSGYSSNTAVWNGFGWWTRTSLGPSARSFHAMAYDSRRRVTVLYGGSAGSEETWEWTGDEWTFVTDEGPGPREGHAMAYDSRRGVTVFFGGYHYLNRYNDTWEWDGVEWRRQSTDGPSPRFGHEMVFDSIRGVTVLFGGYDGSYLSDMWEWDGARWRQVDASGPPVRRNHAMSYDAARRQIVVFGGQDESGNPLGDTWVYRCPSPIHVTVDSACPFGGILRVEWNGGTPFGEGALLYARSDRTTLLSPPNACAGFALGISEGVRLISRLHHGGTGKAAVVGQYSRWACGGYVQVVDLTSCHVSNVVRLE